MNQYHISHQNSKIKNNQRFYRKLQNTKHMFQKYEYISPLMIKSLVINTLLDILNSDIDKNYKQRYANELSKMIKQIDKVLQAENKLESADLGPILVSWTRSGITRKQ